MTIFWYYAYVIPNTAVSYSMRRAPKCGCAAKNWFQTFQYFLSLSDSDLHQSQYWGSQCFTPISDSISNHLLDNKTEFLTYQRFAIKNLGQFEDSAWLQNIPSWSLPDYEAGSLPLRLHDLPSEKTVRKDGWWSQWLKTQIRVPAACHIPSKTYRWPWLQLLPSLKWEL